MMIKLSFFSCETPEKLGNVDIYKSERKANGKWSIPLNLGKQINTPENEESPFLSEDGKTLYFASKGHGGYGGYDIYKSTLKNGIWSDCVNLGIPFNSSGDDIYLTINQNETQGYFSSSRAGGYGDMDIYEIRTEGPFENFIADAEGKLKISMPDTFYINEKITLGATSTKLPPSAFKRYYWQVNDSTLAVEGEIAMYTFLKTGEVSIRVVGLTADNGFIGYEKKVIVTERRIATVVTATTVVTNTTTTVATNTISTGSTSSSGSSSGMDNVYFGFNDNLINTEARATLLRNLKFLNDNPGTTISVAAYSDSRGSAKYNEALSEKRARNVIWYLCKHGLDKKRVNQVTWFGEKDPLNKCTDGTPCTAGEYKINRRVEFKLQGK